MIAKSFRYVLRYAIIFSFGYLAGHRATTFLPLMYTLIGFFTLDFAIVYLMGVYKIGISDHLPYGKN